MKLIVLITLFLFILPSISMSQMLSKDIKEAIERVSAPYIDDDMLKPISTKYLLKQPEKVMLPIYEDLLYDNFLEYELSTWNTSIDKVQDLYRKGSATMLKEMKSPEALKILRKWFDEYPFLNIKLKYSWGVYAAIGALGSYKKTDDISRLEKLAKNQDSDLRYSVVSALSQIGSTNALKTLRDLMLNDSDAGVRINAIKAMKICGDLSVIPDLTLLLEKPEYKGYPKTLENIKLAIKNIKQREEEKLPPQK